MGMRRYVAPTARDCLRRVKEELGSEAVVVSNKQVPGGIEILAMTSEEFEGFSRQTPSRESTPRPAVPPSGGVATRAYAAGAALKAESAGGVHQVAAESDYTVNLSAQGRKAPLLSPAASPWSSSRPSVPEPASQTEEPSRLRPLPGRERAVASAPATSAAGLPSGGAMKGLGTGRGDGPAAAKPASPSIQEVQMQQQVSRLMGEMQDIRTLLERQLAGFAWGEMSRETPVRALALAEMLDAGFSGQLARKLCHEMPSELGMEDALKWLKGALNRNLRTLSSDNDIIDRGGIYALVGPTGVGKTTTTAKLAARCVVRHGADRIALLTTDGYRIGAHEQLRIYGRILGVPVHVVRDGEDLRHTLSDLRDKHMVLIDTVGMSQRDRMVAEQAAMLMRAGEINRLLLLNATTRGDTLDDVVRAYAGDDLAGVILSKVDETASIAPVLDVVIRHGLLLCYVANGQRVPEDMHLPNRNYLMHRAFKTSDEASPHRLQESETGLVMPLSVAARKVAGAVHG
ncbi:MAG: flagellar biosynthesis protein FlhF [Sterolibacterium sp.]|nr:flagellar biosynthesis protein FlhF [Sterolibacterium sp.]MBP9799849.1 flagellar biosynthesis protein FlhF [Sterolibacterium sp.]